MGGSLCVVESDDGKERFYICENHRQEKDDVKVLVKEPEAEKEFFEIESLSLYRKAVNFLTGAS
jgi:hypothetical protein